jgi:hypothetical protein
MATTAEIQCGQFAVTHSDAVVGDSYFAGELNTREQLGLSEGVMDTGLAVDEPGNTTLYAQSFPGEATTVYRETVADYFRIARPPGEDMVFANGDCSVYY